MVNIQLPDVRALKWEVKHHDRERQAPGYWFVAPYGQITGEPSTQKYHQYQVGPYIYDGNGVCDLLRGAELSDTKVNINSSVDAHLGWVKTVR
jgi:hypothetical protein